MMYMSLSVPYSGLWVGVACMLQRGRRRAGIGGKILMPFMIQKLVPYWILLTATPDRPEQAVCRSAQGRLVIDDWTRGQARLCG